MAYRTQFSRSFLSDTALTPLKLMSGPGSRPPFVFYYFFRDCGTFYASDGANVTIVNPAIICYFSELFLKILDEKGRGSALSTLDKDASKRYVLLADTQTLNASIIDFRAAHSLCLTINFPEYEPHPEHSPA